MSMKIRGQTASQMSMEDLVELSRMGGKVGAKARAELQHRTGKVFVKPADAIMPSKPQKHVAARKPKKDETQGDAPAADVSEAA